MTASSRKAAEAAILSAAIDAVVDSARPAVVFVVENRVRPNVDSTTLSRESPLWADFVHHLGEIGPQPGLSPRHDFQMIGPDWRIGGAVTDTTVIAMSAVGLAPSGNDAVVYVDHSCGGRCGSTAYYLFRRIEDRWTLIERQVRSMR